MNPETSSTTNGHVKLDPAMLKALRQMRGMSQEALAELCVRRQLPVSIASIKRAEIGKSLIYRTARHLAAIYGVELADLMPQTMPPMPPPVLAAAVLDEGVRYVVQLRVDMSAPPMHEGRALAAIAAGVGRYGGRITSVVDTCVTCAFGLEHAYRSDAERAARAAIMLSRALVAHGGLALTLRLVGWFDGQYCEDASPALDLCHDDATGASALPVYVARSLHTQLAPRFAFTTEPSANAPYLRLDEARELVGEQESTFVGRAIELRQFDAVLQAVSDDGIGHLVYLRGAAGVGKSRLAQEFALRGRQAGFRCHTAELLDVGCDSWHAPLGQLTRALLGISAATVAAKPTAIDQRLTTLQLPSTLAMFYRSLAGTYLAPEHMSPYAALTQEGRVQGLAQALRALILRLTQDGPLLLTIEDVHWGDARLFEAFGSLLALSREAPVIWVLTAQGEHDPLESSLQPHLFDLPIGLFELAPISTREAHTLAAQYRDLAPDHRQRCVELAQGNALFLTQLLESPAVPFPDSLKHLIQTRIDTLPAQHRHALRMAAVIGSRFDLAILQQALGDPAYTPESAGRNLLVRRASGGAYAFVHELVWHCIYAAIDPTQRQQLHQTVAALYRPRDPATAAQHLYHAQDPGAFDMMLSAIQAKLSSHHYDAALELVDQCCAIEPEQNGSFALALLQSHATAGLGHIPEARAGYEQALRLAVQPQEKIDAVIGLANALGTLNQLENVEQLVDDTLPLARSAKCESALGTLLHIKGNIHIPRGQFSEGRRYQEEAAHYARHSGNQETEALALCAIGDTYYAQGWMKKAQEVFSLGVSKCQEHRFHNTEASHRSTLGAAYIYLGQPKQALSEALQSANMAHEAGDPTAETAARMTASWALCANGQFDAAREQIEIGLELARTTGQHRCEPLLLECKARLSWLQGQPNEAEQLITIAAELVERHGMQRQVGPWVQGTLALLTSSTSLRKKALLRGAAQLTQNCLAHNAYRFYVSAAEVSLLEGDTVTAEFDAEQLDQLARVESCRWLSHHAEMIRAYAAWQEQGSAKYAQQLKHLYSVSKASGFAFSTPRLLESLRSL